MHAEGRPTYMVRLSDLEDYMERHASPASVGTSPKTSSNFRFVTPADPDDTPGFYAHKGTSRAERIRSHNLWQLATPSLSLEFESVIVGTVQRARSHARAVVPLCIMQDRG